MLGASEQFKATGVTFHLSQLSLCLKWGVPVKDGEPVGIPQNPAVKVAIQAALGTPWDF